VPGKRPSHHQALSTLFECVSIACRSDLITTRQYVVCIFITVLKSLASWNLNPCLLYFRSKRRAADYPAENSTAEDAYRTSTCKKPDAGRSLLSFIFRDCWEDMIGIQSNYHYALTLCWKRAVIRHLMAIIKPLVNFRINRRGRRSKPPLPSNPLTLTWRHIGRRATANKKLSDLYGLAVLAAGARGRRQLIEKERTERCNCSIVFH